MGTTRESLTRARGRHEAGDLPGMERICRQILEGDPGKDEAEAHFLLGLALLLQGKAEESVSSYERARALAPDSPDAHNNLGVALKKAGRVDEAATCFLAAIGIAPRFADAHCNLGQVLHYQEDLDGAADCYVRALSLAPDHAEARKCLGQVYHQQGRFAEAGACYGEVLRQAPGDVQLHLNLAMLWLQTGDYARGFAEYEWRRQAEGASQPAITAPLWDGSPLEGRTILLFADHGLGDAIQFIRYVPRVKDRGGRIVVNCRPPLVRLLAACTEVDEVIPEGDPLPHHDAYAPLMSLARIFGTTLETIPDRFPYLTVEPEAASRWRAELGGDASFKVGVSWQGNPAFGKDQTRSFRLAELEAPARVPGVRLYSIQRDHGREQIAGLEGRFPLIDLGDRLDDFMETAAVIANLDLVIAPDTAVAHLAGALGVPAWLAIPHTADWRWLTDREDSPWYPSVRLFRQSRKGDWAGVFRRMADELKHRVETRSNSRAGADRSASG